jgi:Peptidase A4 family
MTKSAFLRRAAYISVCALTATTTIAGTAGSSANASTSSDSQWWEPVSVFHAPAGFDPVTASAAELKELGFPARPTGGAALTTWNSAVSQIKTWETPDPTPGTVPFDGPAGGVSSTTGGGFSTYTVAYWAGHQVTESDAGGDAIDETTAEWTVGKVSANSSYPTSDCHAFTAPLIAEWDGLGDNIVSGSGDIIQAGTFSCSASSSTYGFWTEDYPQAPIWEGVAVSPGNTMYTAVEYDGNGTSTYLLENVTAGTGVAYTNNTPYVDETTAEFILEHPGGDSPAMPSYGTVNFSQCDYYTSSSAYDLTTANNKIIMDDGHGDSTTGAVSSSSFPVTWVSGT